LHFRGRARYFTRMLKLYNSLSRAEEVFRPRVKGRVKIFTCGPSTYRRPHVGNYRTFLYEDILVRYLSYSGLEVQRVINFTDVEDKMLEEAVLEGRKPQLIAAEVEKRFLHEARLLGIRLPRVIAKASASVPQAVRLIQRLLRRGLAYWHDGDVFFEPLKYKQFGKLFRLDMSRWPKSRVRFKKDTYNGQRWNLGDFILWHGYRNGDLSAWDTAIGRGRPSWNIQDPAMITEHLGFQVDINCGGIDNIYRHHDYNIAILESLSGKSYANYYLHGAHLIVDGKPMSKSRGNIRYPEDLLGDGLEARHLRFFLVYKHYRRRLNLTPANLRKAAGRLDGVRALARELTAGGAERSGARPGGGPRLPEAESRLVESQIAALREDFRKHMDADLAVGRAVDAIHARLSSLRRSHARLPAGLARHLRTELAACDEVLGFLL
jgi:cysteinyl-tRNA synthetase